MELKTEAVSVVLPRQSCRGRVSVNVGRQHESPNSK